MAEETTSPGNGQTNPQFAIQRVYLKDLSFETPLGPDVFRKQWQPKVKQDIGTKTNKLDGDLHEVVLSITITASIEEQTAFLVEVQQAGIFNLAGFNEQQLTQIINTVCPGLLFPYVREAIDSVVVKGSFPAVNLPPINFDALFQQAVAKQAGAGTAPEASH